MSDRLQIISGALIQNRGFICDLCIAISVNINFFQIIIKAALAKKMG